MQTGVYTQMIHSVHEKTMVLDENKPITRERFIELFTNLKTVSGEYRVVYGLDGTIKTRWRDIATIVTCEYTPNK